MNNQFDTVKRPVDNTYQQKTRICLVVSSFPQLSETFIVNKFYELVKRGWDVYLVCTTSLKQNWKYFPQLDTPQIRARVHCLWPLSPRWLAWLLIPAAVLRCLVRKPTLTERYLRRGWQLFGWRVLWQLYQDAELICLVPDLLHFEFGAPAPQRMYLKEILQCKVVASFRGYDLNFSGLEQPDFYQPVWEKADGLHLLSQALWQRAQQRGCPPQKKHALIPPAIDLAAFSPDQKEESIKTLGTLEQPLHLLSVGRLEWEKGYEFAMQAVRLLQDQGLHCRYRILGGGEYLEALAFARRQLCLDESVEFLGAQPHAEVKRQMNWAHVFLHAAVSEGFGNAVLEAQAMQLPVVCSDAGGLSENVRHGESGFVVPRRDPAALAEKLALLACESQIRHSMGMKGRERIEKNFFLESQIDNFESFYAQINSEGL